MSWKTYRLADRLAQFDQQPLVRLVEVGSPAQVPPEDLVLSLEVLDLLGQVAVRAAGEKKQ
ncbi:MAG: hypothetical protein JWN40_3019 [Phycisphaerales bacterium]|nr:hypothetical protein [Phycisphaerales bacterium]